MSNMKNFNAKTETALIDLQIPIVVTDFDMTCTEITCQTLAGEVITIDRCDFERWECYEPIGAGSIQETDDMIVCRELSGFLNTMQDSLIELKENLGCESDTIDILGRITDLTKI